MPIYMIDAVDFTNTACLNFIVPIVPTDPTGYKAGLIFNDTEKALKYHNGTAWTALGAAGTGGPPSGPAGGDLTGSYPNPTILAGVIVDADVNASAAIAQTKIANLVTDLGNKANSSALANYQLKSERGVANGYPGLDPNALIPTTHLPPLAINEVFVVASEAAMLALTAQRGDMAIRTDVSKTFVLSTDVPSVLANWKEITAAGAVLSVNGKTGVVTITLAELGGVATSRQVIAGNGLTGGGDFSADRTLNVVGDANLSVGADLVSVLSAPKWTTPRSITLTGDVTGSVASVDGSANISIPTTAVAAAKRYSAVVTATGTSVPITHNLNTKDVQVQLYRNASPWDTVVCGVERTDVNTVTLKFDASIAANAFRVVVLA